MKNPLDHEAAKGFAHEGLRTDRYERINADEIQTLAACYLDLSTLITATFKESIGRDYMHLPINEAVAKRIRELEAKHNRLKELAQASLDAGRFNPVASAAQITANAALSDFLKE